MINEFESSENFDESTIDAPIEQEQTDQDLVAESFNKERDELLGIEPEPTTDEVKPVFSDDDFKAIVEKANAFDAYKSEAQSKFNKAFGTIGQLQAELKTIKERVSSPVQSQTEKLTKERFAKLTEYFDDDAVAQALAEDLGELTIQGQQTPFDMEAFNTEQEAKWQYLESRLKNETHKDLLTAIHPDWQDITLKKGSDGNPIVGDDGRYLHTDNFSAWHKSLSPEAQVKVLSANDAPTLINVLNEFKKWDLKKTEFEQKKQQRLEDNIPIKEGTSGRHITHSSSAYDQELKRILESRA